MRFTTKSWKSHYYQQTSQSWAQKKYLYGQLQMYKNSFFRCLVCKSIRKAMSHRLFMLCMGLNLTLSLISLIYPSSSCAALQVLPNQCPEPDFAAMVWSRRSEWDTVNHTTHLSPGLPLVWPAAAGQGLVPRESCNAPQSRVAGPWLELEKHTFPCFTCACAGGTLWEMNTSGHFNHQPWQWRWQWICFNWISSGRKDGRGRK